MVTRHEKTPSSSRGNSPSRTNNPSPTKTKSSPLKTLIRKGLSPERSRKTTPEKLIIKSRGNSPARVKESRGSE